MVVEAFVVRSRNSARSTFGFFARAALFAFVFVVMGVSSVSAAPTPFQARGIWLCCGPIVAGTNFVITGGTNSKFTATTKEQTATCSEQSAAVCPAPR